MKNARTAVGMLALVAGAAAGAVTGGLALASTTPTLKTANNSTLNETIVVNSKGQTLYELSPETIHHLLCKTSACFGFWPPLTVKSSKTKLTAAKGISGKLGIIKRGKLFQVTLGGRPLYRFSYDTNTGQANGQGIKSFGGTWHVIKVASSASHTTSTMTTSTTTSTGYTYVPPGY